MRRAERLYRLIDEMRTRPVTRADDLADALEVSARTVYRDIAHLQASGVPIDGEAGVGYMLRPRFDMPGIALTHDQVDALAAGLAFVEAAGDAALATAAREVRAKLQAGMPSPEARRLADAPFHALHPASEAPVHAGMLRRAVREHRVVRMRYADAEGRPSERRVRPLVMWSLPDGWMVSGWCEARGAFRTFRLDRINALDLMDDGFEATGPTGLRAFMRHERCEV